MLLAIHASRRSSRSRATTTISSGSLERSLPSVILLQGMHGRVMVCVCVNEVWENQYHTFTPVFSNSHSTDFACFSMCMKTETTPHSQPPPQSLAPSQYQWFPTPHPSPGTTHLAASEASMAARKGVRPLAVSRRSTTWSLETTAKHCAQTVQASMPG